MTSHPNRSSADIERVVAALNYRLGDGTVHT
jgi:hypothetical protein